MPSTAGNGWRGRHLGRYSRAIGDSWLIMCGHTDLWDDLPHCGTAVRSPSRVSRVDFLVIRPPAHLFFEHFDGLVDPLCILLN